MQKDKRFFKCDTNSDFSPEKYHFLLENMGYKQDFQAISWCNDRKITICITNRIINIYCNLFDNSFAFSEAATIPGYMCI